MRRRISPCCSTSVFLYLFTAFTAFTAKEKHKQVDLDKKLIYNYFIMAPKIQHLPHILTYFKLGHAHITVADSKAYFELFRGVKTFSKVFGMLGLHSKRVSRYIRSVQFKNSFIGTKRPYSSLKGMSL